MDAIKPLTGGIERIYSEPLELSEPFIQTARRFSHMPGTVLLMSGGKLDCARYHILGMSPWLTFHGRNRKMQVQVGDRMICFEADPLDALRNILDSYRFEPGHNILENTPLTSGLMGYLSYDLKDAIEKLPRTSVDDMGLPHIWLAAPSVLLIHDRTMGRTRLLIPKFQGDGETVEHRITKFKETLTAPSPGEGIFSGSPDGFRSNFTRPGYMESIRRIREYIASGHVYQVNMSQRFDMGFQGDPFALFEMLYNRNPAPFFAYIHAGDHHIVSTSPERFILQQGRAVETRPIKGTRPRGKKPEEDAALSEALKNSRKDDAELSMIVDLLRNDIGKVCKAGSVRVTEHKRLEAYENVWHLVSIVAGELDDSRDAVDLIRAAFPGGSITGCPKIRSMEIIDELEPTRRHIYTGSIGYISFHDTMDLSIAIRTAVLCGDKIVFSVGGGIVYDSDPGDEYEETLHKGRTLMAVFQGRGTASQRKNWVWFNGSLKPLEDSTLPAGCPGFQYGHGFFETIRVEKGNPVFLARHMERFSKAWLEFFTSEPPDLTWEDIIAQVIDHNGLGNQAAAVKIIAAKGDRTQPPFNHTLAVIARPYVHRLEGKDPAGLNLAVYPHPRQTPLADHKTLNYLYYFQAGHWAKQTGADEALILNPDGTVSETNSANILALKGKTVFLPASKHVLPGIMEQGVCEYLAGIGYQAERVPLRPEDLTSADQVLLTNSLIGAAPVLSLDGKILKQLSFPLWRRINEAVFTPPSPFGRGAGGEGI
jgi:para-aminobenzoate synthetase component 1